MIFWTNNCLLFAGILTSELFAATLRGCLSSCLFTVCGQHPYTADENVRSCIFHGNTIRCFSTVAHSMGSQPAGGPQYEYQGHCKKCAPKKCTFEKNLIICTCQQFGQLVCWCKICAHSLERQTRFFILSKFSILHSLLFLLSTVGMYFWTFWPGGCTQFWTGGVSFR